MADMNGVVTSGESDGGGLLGDIIDLEWTDGDFCLFCSSVVDGNSDTKLEEWYLLYINPICIISYYYIYILLYTPKLLTQI